MPTVAEIVTAAVADFADNGFQSNQQLDQWVGRLRAAIVATLPSQVESQNAMRDALQAVYDRLVINGGITRDHPGIPVSTINRIAPQLRTELNRRILASANLIKINRAEQIEKTLRRLSGWVTSLPAGGSRNIDRNAVKADINKSYRSLPFIERRVLIDQGHKLNASISATLASGSGAIAATWFSHWQQPGYDYREAHKERAADAHGSRDGHVYLVRNNWAQEAGLIKPGDAGYTDEITQPAEEPFCRCRWVWLYNLRQLPPEMLTKKGAASLASTRIA